MDLIKNIKVKPLTVPMRAPFVTALGRKSTSHNLLIGVQTDTGLLGWGEASASLALPHEARGPMTDWIRSVQEELIGSPLDQWHPLRNETAPLLPHAERHPTAWGALQTALLEAIAQKNHRSLHALFGKNKKSIKTDITLSATFQEEFFTQASFYYKEGFRRFKIKIGKFRFFEDLHRLFLFQRYFPGCELWLDANQGLTFEKAKIWLTQISQYNLNVTGFEQPLPKNQVKLLQALQRQSTIPLYADESASDVSRVKKLLDMKAVEGVVIKIAKTLLSQAWQIRQLAKARKKKVMISCMAESARGLAPSVHWAIGDGEFDWVDLDSHLLTNTQIPNDLYTSRGPVLSLSSLIAQRDDPSFNSQSSGSKHP